MNQPSILPNLMSKIFRDKAIRINIRTNSIIRCNSQEVMVKIDKVYN